MTRPRILGLPTWAWAAVLALLALLATAIDAVIQWQSTLGQLTFAFGAACVWVVIVLYALHRPAIAFLGGIPLLVLGVVVTQTAPDAYYAQTRPSCGHAVTAPATGSVVLRAPAQCFAQAFAHCTPRSLTVEERGDSVDYRRDFAIENSDHSCTVAVRELTWGDWTTARCTAVTLSAAVLHIAGCTGTANYGQSYDFGTVDGPLPDVASPSPAPSASPTR